MKVRLRSLRILLIPIALLLAYGVYCLGLSLSGNYHTVIAGELYRSAQPTAQDLEKAVARDGIRSVLNLRGPNAGSDWYEEEMATSKRLNLAHYDMGLKASREITKEQAQQLITLMRDSPKPLLVHCKQGSDRSGLAAALYLLEIKQRTPEESGKQLSLIYGHIPFSFSGGYGMTKSFENISATLPQ
jgi:protein tyrosine/serine phosphatase